MSITTGKTYWINLKYDGSHETVYLAYFDPDNSYALLGTAIAPSIYRSTTWGTRSTSAAAIIIKIRAMTRHIATSTKSWSIIPTGRFRSCLAVPTTPPPPRPAVVREEPAKISPSRSRPRNCRPIGTGLGCRERHQRLPICHRHHSGGTNVVNWTTIPCQWNNEDGLEPDHGSNLLFQREGHQRRGVDRPAGRIPMGKR